MDTRQEALPERLRQILDFLLFVDRFKTIQRQGHVDGGSRHETDAEHTWHMALYAVLLHGEIGLDCDLLQTLKMVPIHDLVEIHAGDAYAYDEAAQAGQAEREQAAATKIYSMLPNDLGSELLFLWQEFEAGETAEAKFARALDRLQAFGQSIATNGKGWHDHGVRRSQTERRMAPARSVDPVVTALIDALYRRADRDGMWPHPDDRT
jgi:putative hydrolase of HD superfamily